MKPGRNQQQRQQMQQQGSGGTPSSLPLAIHDISLYRQPQSSTGGQQTADADAIARTLADRLQHGRLVYTWVGDRCMVALRPASPAAYHGHISAPAALGGIGRTGQSGGLVGGAAGGSDSGSTGDAASELLSKERATSLKLSTAAFPAASLYAASHATRSSNSKNGSSASSGANSQASSAANTPGRPLPPQTAGSAASFNQRRPSFVQPLPPHVFDLVASAFVHMINDKQDQCVILSGESNCGKSESGRLIARHLCDLTKLSASAKKTRIHSGAMKLDFVLSAFGNAVTPENTNASRFSRYTEYQFDENGFMAGVKILAYNLEKSRVTEASDAHANFDVFYYLLAGIDAGMRAKWSLAEPSHFAYLNRVQSKPAVLLTHHHFDPDNLEKLRHHLSAVGIAKQTHDDMFRLLAAILNLGNIAFARTAELSANEPCTIKNLPQLETTAELLGLRAEHLMAALTYETKAVGRELCTVILDLDGAARQRDRLAQLLYSLLFQWIVEATNARMCKEEADWANYISVVDFASVQASSPGSASSSASPHGPAAANGRGLLSRLVTNYASERLHGFVLDQMALSVDRLVAARAVPEHSKTAAAAIESNQTVLRLLGAPSTGIIAILQKDVSRRERFGAGIGLVGSIKGSGSGGANGTAPARASRVLRASRVGSMFFGAGHSITGGSGANAAQGSSATASLPSTAAQQAVLDRISRICGDNPKLSLVASISTTATRQQYNTAFGIHHYSGMVHYDMSMLDASTSDASTSISTDFVSLFCGSMDQPATRFAFVRQLFSKRAIAVDMHPKNRQTLMRARQSLLPARRPSTLRRRQTIRAGDASVAHSRAPSGNMTISHDPLQSMAADGGSGGAGDTTVMMDAGDVSVMSTMQGSPSSSLDSDSLFQQTKASMDDLIDSLECTNLWFAIHLRPHAYARGGTAIDIADITRQVRGMQIDAIANSMSMLYVCGMPFELLLSRLQDIVGPDTIPEGGSLGMAVEAMASGDMDGMSDMFPERLQEAAVEALDLFAIESDLYLCGDRQVFLTETGARMLYTRLNRGNLLLGQSVSTPDSSRATTRPSSGVSTESVGPGPQDGAFDVYDHSPNDRLIAASGRAHHGSGASIAPSRASLLSADDDVMDIVSTYDFTRAQGRATYDGRPSQDSRYQKDIELGNLPLPAARQQDVSAQNNQHFQQGSAETLVQTSNKPRDATKSARPRTAARSWWVCITWSLTWWIPTCCIATVFGKRRPDVQMAWREKVALCVIIFLMCATMLFFIIGLGRILCPRQNVLSEGEVSQFNTLAEPFVVVFGNYYRIADVVQSHVLGGNAYLGAPAFMSTVLGRDVSAMFYPSRLPEKYCPGMNLPAGWDNVYNRNNQGTPQIWYGHLQSSPVNNKTIDYLANMAYMKKGQIARSKEWISSFLDSDGNHKIIVAWGKVYDITTYYDPSNVGAQATSPGFFGNLVKQIFDAFSQSSNRGRDATDTLNQLKEPRYGGPVFFAQFRTCMDNMFYTGVVDTRTDLKCVLPNYIMLAASCVLVLVIGFKFVGALQLNGRSNPEDHTKFVICQVPCYTEGEDSLRRTINSLACTQYSDSRKLLFIICDGMIIGAGNDRPTPRIVLDILGVDEDVDPEPQSFQSLGKASKQHNMGKVYSGLYDVEGHLVPFIVIVKVGTPSERVKPGNRGKRDSQLVLMRFLNRVHFAAPLAPLELEMFHHMKNIIGVPPMMYEYVLMVDADTEVLPDSLNMLVSSMIIDGNIMGICGETQLSNENDSWVTMIQVYEYYISHHLSKAFESLFGSVTCLPGCFCMYRLRSSNGKNTPLLVSPQVLADYSENNVDTLHLKNLLELGEDRYLTTLLLKHFPTLKTKFVQGALCQTGAPDRWSVLLSQRRRWINSTVHNLFELVFLSELCGVCCFSMRFVVLIDLFATFLQPASIIYVLYLIYVAAFDKATAFPMISLIMLACIYGLQMIIFLIKREWQHVGWMIIYILAMPVFGFFVPLYAFWHFDDFSWGNTRLAAGAGGDAGAEHGGSKRGGYADDAEMFDPQSIPVESWESYEARAGWVQAAGTSTGYATADADRIMATALLTDLERRDSNMRLDDQVDAVSIGSRSAGLAYQGQQQMSTAAAGGGPRLGSTRSSRPIQYPPPLMMPAAPPAAGAVADSASIYTRHRHHRETDRMSQTSHSSHGSHHSHGSHGSHGSHRKHAARQHAANTSYRSQGSQGVGSSQPYKPQAYYDPLHPSSAHPRSQLNQQSVSSPQSAGVMYPPQALVATSSPMSPTSSTVQHQPLPLLPLSTRSQPPSQASQLQPPMADRGRILEAVQSFIQASDLSTITKRHVRERVMQELGLDAVASRRVVDDCIRTVLADLDG